METKYYFTYTDLWPDEGPTFVKKEDAMETLCCHVPLDDYDHSIFANNDIYNNLAYLLINRWSSSENIYLLVISEDTPVAEAVKKLAQKILVHMQLTSEKYYQKIKHYQNELQNITIPTELVSKSESRFNDTPTEEGNYNTDRFTTNITQSQTTTPIDPVTRYEQVKNLIEDLYGEWVDTFKRFEIYA